MHPVEALSTPIAIKVSPKQTHLKPNVTKARVSSNKIHGVDLSVWILQFGQTKSITTVQAPWPVFRSALRNLKNVRMELNDRDYFNNRGTGSLRGVEISRLPSRSSGKNRTTRQSIGYWRRKSTAEMALRVCSRGRKKRLPNLGWIFNFVFSRLQKDKLVFCAKWASARNKAQV